MTATFGDQPLGACRIYNNCSFLSLGKCLFCQCHIADASKCSAECLLPYAIFCSLTLQMLNCVTGIVEFRMYTNGRNSWQCVRLAGMLCVPLRSTQFSAQPEKNVMIIIMLAEYWRCVLSKTGHTTYQTAYTRAMRTQMHTHTACET